MDFLKIKTLQEEEYFSDSSESSELDVSFLFETDGGLEFKISEPLPLTRALDAIITQQRSQLDISSDTEDSDYGDDTITTRKEALEPEDKQEENEYFEEYQETSNHDTFPSLSISRPILKAIAELGFVKPTNIQQQAIPIALQGRDICGSAVTGSGKTAAFMIPILERLLFRPRSISCIRVLIIVPTRELGAQCHEVAVNLGKYTSIESCLCVGGLSTKQQEAELKRKPDIVIATPGRLIDHIHNSPTFSLDDIEILVIDEADRILEVGFQDELKEIIKNTPVKRQTMLFSATMTTNIDELVQLSLKRPVKLFVDSSTSMTGKLVQEFVRIREHREETRPAILAALCARTYQSETLVFFKSKAAAHHMKIVFGLLGLKAAELHGNLTQQQRLESLELFKEKKVDFLLCTDVASRGLDIAGIKTVINYDMPSTYQIYIHRCGRTARANAAGKAVSLVGEADRQILKLALKNGRDEVKHRVLPTKVLQKYESLYQSLEPALKEVYRLEKDEKEFNNLNMQLTKAENLITHDQEIKSRPKRTWFKAEPSPLPPTRKQKHASNHSQLAEQEQLSKRKAKLAKLPRKKKRLHEARQQDKQLIANQTVAASKAKKIARTTKLGKLESGKVKSAGGNSRGKKKRRAGAFEAEIGKI